jgi:hypothetical protein
MAVEREPAALPDWLTFESVYEGDDETTLDLFTDLAAYSEGRGLPAAYPADPAEAALIAEEAHLRACNVCHLNRPEDACPEGKQLEARRVTTATTNAAPAAGARPMRATQGEAPDRG